VSPSGLVIAGWHAHVSMVRFKAVHAFVRGHVEWRHTHGFLHAHALEAIHRHAGGLMLLAKEDLHSARTHTGGVTTSGSPYPWTIGEA